MYVMILFCSILFAALLIGTVVTVLGKHAYKTYFSWSAPHYRDKDNAPKFWKFCGKLYEDHSWIQITSWIISGCIGFCIVVCVIVLSINFGIRERTWRDWDTNYFNILAELGVDDVDYGTTLWQKEDADSILTIFGLEVQDAKRAGEIPLSNDSNIYLKWDRDMWHIYIPVNASWLDDGGKYEGLYSSHLRHEDIKHINEDIWQDAYWHDNPWVNWYHFGFKSLYPQIHIIKGAAN